MAAAVHVIDAGAGASALHACAVRAMSGRDGCPVVAIGDSAGCATLSRGGLRIETWASAPCGMPVFAARPLVRVLRAACGGDAPMGVTCWSADPGLAQALVRSVRRAVARADVHAGSVGDAIASLDVVGGIERRMGHAPIDAVAPVPGAPPGTEAPSRHALRESIGASEGSVVVAVAADAPRCAHAGRMLDVVGRAMLAGADVHMVLPGCMPHMARTLRYARGLGIDSRVHVIEGAEWPMPWWRASDAVLVTDESPMVCSVASAMGIMVVRALGRPDDASSPERRAASAAARDLAASALIDAARERSQPAMKASAASA